MKIKWYEIVFILIVVVLLIIIAFTFKNNNLILKQKNTSLSIYTYKKLENLKKSLNWLLLFNNFYIISYFKHKSQTKK